MPESPEDKNVGTGQPATAPLTPEPTPATPPPQGGQAGWSNEEKGEYIRKTERLAAIEKQAAEAGYDSAIDYMADLEKQNLELANRISSPPPQPNTFPADTPVSPPPVAQPQVNDDSPTRDDLRQLQAAHLKTAMTLDYREFKTDQKELTEADRFGFTKKELDAVLGDAVYSAAISAKYRKQMEETGEANFYALAAETKVVVYGKAKVKKEGAEQQQALTKAEQAASLATSTAPPAPDGKIDENQQRADDIVPDDAPYEYSDRS